MNFYQAYIIRTNKLFSKKYDDAISYYKKSLMLIQMTMQIFKQEILFETIITMKHLHISKNLIPIQDAEIITYIVTILYKIGEYHLAFNYLEKV